MTGIVLLTQRIMYVVVIHVRMLVNLMIIITGVRITRTVVIILRSVRLLLILVLTVFLILLMIMIIIIIKMTLMFRLLPIMTTIMIMRLAPQRARGWDASVPPPPLCGRRGDGSRKQGLLPVCRAAEGLRNIARVGVPPSALDERLRLRRSRAGSCGSRTDSPRHLLLERLRRRRVGELSSWHGRPAPAEHGNKEAGPLAKPTNFPNMRRRALRAPPTHASRYPGLRAPACAMAMAHRDWRSIITLFSGGHRRRSRATSARRRHMCRHRRSSGKCFALARYARPEAMVPLVATMRTGARARARHADRLLRPRARGSEGIGEDAPRHELLVLDPVSLVLHAAAALVPEHAMDVHHPEVGAAAQRDAREDVARPGATDGPTKAHRQVADVV